MPVFPTFTRSFTLEGYSYEVRPDVSFTGFYSGNTRQRKHLDKNDVRFSVRLVLSDSELTTFESFVTTDIDYGSLTYDGPYFTGGASQTGTCEMVEGSYNASNIQNKAWSVTYQFDLKARDYTQEDSTYEVINYFGAFGETDNVLDALANMVNNNNL